MGTTGLNDSLHCAKSGGVVLWLAWSVTNGRWKISVPLIASPIASVWRHIAAEMTILWIFRIVNLWNGLKREGYGGEEV